jgi:hypothetical protein
LPDEPTERWRGMRSTMLKHSSAKLGRSVVGLGSVSSVKEMLNSCSEAPDRVCRKARGSEQAHFVTCGCYRGRNQHRADRPGTVGARNKLGWPPPTPATGTFHGHARGRH